MAATAAFRSARKHSISSGSMPPNIAPEAMPASPSPFPPAVVAAMGATGPGSGFRSAAGSISSEAGAPVAANTIANKPAVAGSSLYQACLTLRDRLWCVEGFGERYLDDGNGSGPYPGANGAGSTAGSRTSGSSPINGSAPPSPRLGNAPKARTGSASDPVTQLWQCFRLGAPLCWLFNRLGPQTELALNRDANASNANECKKQVAKFIIALKSELGWDPDEIFTVSQLYLNDTNGFVRVVRTVSKLLDEFEARGLLLAPAEGMLTPSDVLEKPSDERAFIVRELLDTERKYVQDLEVMQNYARALGQNDVLPPDTIHNLFGNLNTLVDVQRRFLICVEDNVRRPADDQHFGHVFQTMEADFSAYEPFCANYAQALDIISAESSNIQRLRGMPAAEGCYLDPSYELPTFLIKPVQRICKYPLLLEQLLKKTPQDSPIYHELDAGLTVIRRITDRVNETRRLQENHQLVRDLESRVEDWKGHNITTFGNLLLSDVFMVSKSDTEREYHVYLFEKILLCCKELQPNQSKKSSKSNSLLKQKTASASAPPGKKPKTTLQLKGRIFINNVTAALPNSKPGAILGAPAPGQHSLQVWWRGDVDQESFSLRCKNEEQLRQWQIAIQRLIDEVNQRRANAALHWSSSSSTAASPGGISPGALAVRRNTGGSSFPQTPLTEMGSAYPFTRTDSQASYRPSISGGEEPEGMRDFGDMSAAHSVGGPSPSAAVPALAPAAVPGRYSTPAEHRERKLSLSSGESRPRALTEDQGSALMSQWRSRSPNVPPPLPRNQSSSSAGSSDHASLRKASSSRQLRQPGYSAAGPGGYPRPPRQSGEPGTPSDPGEMTEQLESLTVRQRGDSVVSSMARTSSEAGSSSHYRSRSSSNPALFPHGHMPGPAPPVPRAPYPPHLVTNHGELAPNGHLSSGPPSAATSSSAPGLVSAAAPHDKRFSASSVSTVDSARSLGSRRESTAASSPNTMSGSSGSMGAKFAAAAAAAAATGTGAPAMPQGMPASGSGGALSSSSSRSTTVPTPTQPSHHASAHMQPPPQHQLHFQQQHQPQPQMVGGGGASLSHSNAVKVVVRWGEDRLVLVVLASICYAELVDKLAHKVRSVAGRRPEASPLRVRYIDEDGDRILMQDDEDVQMAFEQGRQSGRDVELVVS